MTNTNFWNNCTNIGDELVVAHSWQVAKCWNEQVGIVYPAHNLSFRMSAVRDEI